MNPEKTSLPQHDGPTVLIVGAGPTGLTLACELARRSVSFRLIEASSGPQPGSRGKGLQPRSLEVLDDLGVGERVMANGRLGLPMCTIAPDGCGELHGADAPPPRPDIPYQTSLITPEWRIEEALRLRLADLGGSVDFGHEFVGFEQTDTAVSASIICSGRRETVTARWLVGCDGGHSLVRRQAAISFDGETREEVRMIVADVEAEGLDREIWRLWNHDDGIFSLCPLPSTEVFQYQAMIRPGQDPDLSLSNMQAILERRTSRTDIRIREPSWSSLWRANVRLVEHYRSGRVFLAGDAAHIHSPAGGQGMNTGIQDSQNLGWKLAAVDKGAPAVLLDTYEAERRPVAEGVLSLSDKRLKEALSHKGIPLHRDATVMQLDIRYRSSPLARDDRDDRAALRAGDRAPDATNLMTVHGKRRLFDLTRGGRFTLLDFGSGASLEGSSAGLMTIRVVKNPSALDHVVDTEGHLARAYEAKSASLVLVRPDGYVGFISDAGSVSRLMDYLCLIS